MCMKPRLRCAETRFAKLCNVSKGFNWVCAKLLVGCADSRFAKPRSSFLEGFNFVCAKPQLRRADSRFAKPRNSLRGRRFYSFRLYEKNGEYPRGLRTSGLRGRFKALSKKISAKLSGGTCRTRLFAQNSGVKALNRCERGTVVQTQD